MRSRIAWLAGPLFVVAGTLHFTHTRRYEAVMPPYLPAHRELILSLIHISEPTRPY